MKILILLMFAFVLPQSCATGGKKKKSSSSLSSSSSSPSRSRRKAPDNRREISVSGGTKSFTNSLSNGSGSSKTVDKGKARSLASKLDRQVRVAKKVDPRDVVALMAAKRLSGGTTSEVINAAKKLVGQEVKKDINSKLSEEAQLEIALSAFQNKQYGMAEYYIIQLVDSKKKNIKSAALNLDGLMKYKFSTHGNAAAIWQESLKADSSNQAARLNLALLALRYSDFKTSTQLLAATEQDWFTQGNLAVAEKLANKGKRAQELCKRALQKQSKNRALLFNCAVADFQVVGDYAAAMDKLNKANSMSGGGADLSDKIVKAMRMVKQKQSAMKAGDKPKKK